MRPNPEHRRGELKPQSPTILAALAAVAAVTLVAVSLPALAAAEPATLADGASETHDVGGNAAKPDGKLTLDISFGGRFVAEQSGAFAVDASGAQAPDSVEIGSRLSLRQVAEATMGGGAMRSQAVVGLELAHGVFSGRPTLAGDHRPGDVWSPALLSEAYVAAAIGKEPTGNGVVGLRAGLMLSHWGLGILANDGRGYLKGDATSWFSQPYVGDRVLRAALWSRPFANSTSALRGLFVSVAADRVATDDILRPAVAPGFFAVHPDDVAWQGIFAGRFFLNKTDWLGVYYVYRDQKLQSDAVGAGKGLQIHAVDVAAELDIVRNDRMSLRLSAEAVAITGKTTLGPSPDFPEHDVAQGAAVGRLDLRMGATSAMLDLGYFSGDLSTDDGTIGNFKADPNFQQGILLFRRVVGWQSARMRLSASDPNIVGYPNEDLDRLGTGGSITSTITIFPRIGRRFGMFEAYGGLLIALSPTPIADPFQSRTEGGGSPRSVLGGAPNGIVLGTEVDVGVRAHLPLGQSGTELMAGIEYGVVMPGGVLAGLDDNIMGGRFTLTLTGDPAAKGR
jgi:hypothetical protein